MNALSIDETWRIVTHAVAATHATETVPLRQAFGRCNVEDIRAGGDQPRFDSSAMDGWAVADGAGAHEYRIVGESRAGVGFDRAIEAGEAVHISTGAVIPQGATAIVRRERGMVRGQTLIAGEIAPGRDMRQRGCDFRKGDLLLAAGRQIDHFDIARLAASGLAHLCVARRPNLALLATGDEIVVSGAVAGPGGNYDALSPALWARMTQLGATITDLGVAPDHDGSIFDRAISSDARLLIVTGGASGGRHDRVRAALGPMGLEVLVPAVRMRPGKPFWFGRWGRDGERLVVGLPGNPVAALAALELFVVPTLMAAQGLSPVMAWRPCASMPVRAGTGGERVRFARRSGDGVDIIGMEDSAALSPLLGANALCRQTDFGTRMADLLGWPASSGEDAQFSTAPSRYLASS
ncbi:molybdopterin molybdotransferase MoeA [Novosphingobium sp. BL-8H]|uniref:molybdopterin molybdotransferase MoeA n=1 Tax=Novosphingobium sp. BL-8H TaxID=3127640 RepID=UPI0037570FB8